MAFRKAPKKSALRRVPLGSDHRVIAEARLAARERPLRSTRGVLSDEGRWAAAASHRILRHCVAGDVVRLRLIETPSAHVTLRVERVSSGRSTALTGTVIDASKEAIDLQFDLARGFYSFPLGARSSGRGSAVLMAFGKAPKKSAPLTWVCKCGVALSARILFCGRCHTGQKKEKT